MKRTTPFLTPIIFTAAFLASGCASLLAGTPIAVGETQRGSAGVPTATAQSKTLAGRVVSIADGDTLIMLDAERCAALR